MQEEIEVKVATLCEKMSVANHRIDDLEATTQRIESLTLSVEKLSMSIEQMVKEQCQQREAQNQLADRLLKVEQLPYQDKAGKWDLVWKQVLVAITSGVVGYLISLIV